MYVFLNESKKAPVDSDRVLLTHHEYLHPKIPFSLSGRDCWEAMFLSDHIPVTFVRFTKIYFLFSAVFHWQATIMGPVSRYFMT